MHFGSFAENYKNKLLTTRNSMWSILELAPFDVEETETIINIKFLIDTLKSLTLNELAKRVEDETKILLILIKEKYDVLPRTTIHSDLNDTNITVNDDKFAGLIDFNLYGNETNINAFLNETIYFIKEEDIKVLSEVEIFFKMKQIQEERMTYVLTNYTLSADERAMIKNIKS